MIDKESRRAAERRETMATVTGGIVGSIIAVATLLGLVAVTASVAHVLGRLGVPDDGATVAAAALVSGAFGAAMALLWMKGNE